MKVPEPLAVESSGFFVALFQVHSYKPTFDQLKQNGLAVPS
jgi:hypothetical protein